MADSTRIFHVGLATYSSHGMQPTHDAIVTAIEAKDYERAVDLCREGTNERVLAQMIRSRGAVPPAVGSLTL